MEQMRADFEAAQVGIDLRRHATYGYYIDPEAQARWEGFRVGISIGRAQATTEAAAICDAEAKAAHATGAWETHSRLRRCADAIRAAPARGADVAPQRSD